MKVDSTTSSNLSSPKGGVQGARQGDTAPVTNQGASSAPAAGGHRTPADANVNLSALSSQLRTLAASGSADIDIEQVESIKQAIKDGTLSIDTGKIAEGILETARSLLYKPQSSGG